MSATASWRDVLEGRSRWAVVGGDCLAVLPEFPAKSVAHVISDAPYSQHVHGKSRRGASLPDTKGEQWHGESRGGAACFNRSRDLGFEAITPAQMTACAAEFARISSRWVLEFCDDEISGDWMRAFVGVGLQHIRIGHWIKIGCTPQFTGDRPAIGSEAIVVAHPAGRKRWNGGGSHAIWTHPIVLERGDGSLRVHTTQKPESLMAELVELFTDPDEIVLDPFAGSGTTGVACLRLGRRFIGIEKEPKYAAIARDRLLAEERGQSLREYRAGQLSLLHDVEKTG